MLQRGKRSSVIQLLLCASLLFALCAKSVLLQVLLQVQLISVLMLQFITAASDSLQVKNVKYELHL